MFCHFARVAELNRVRCPQKCSFAGLALNFMSVPRVELLLARHADSAWRGAICPWLKATHTKLTRSFVVVPTRGQAQGLKQRCVIENLPLLGVEFLSPGLARQKWLPLVGGKPVLGRELLLFELRVAIAKRLQLLEPNATGRGLLKSLLSDAECALDDFDELLKAGFCADDFADELLKNIFRELTVRVDELGYSLGALQSEKAALESVPADAPRIGGRLLIYGLSAEAWGEFFNVAAFVRRFEDITVVLPEPEFRGRRMLDENWIEVWQTLLGVSAIPLDEPPPSQSCEYVASWWNAGSAEVFLKDAKSPRVLVGQTQGEEMRLVADEVVRLMAKSASDVAVVFPKADAAHAKLGRMLSDRGVAFVDLLPGVGAPSLEARLQRALLAFYERGGRLDELLTLWPLLRAAGLVQISSGSARRVCERLFEDRQTHALSAYSEILVGRDRPEWKEVSRLVSLLLPIWPDELTLTEAVERFQATCERLALPLPSGWAALSVFAAREMRVLPAQEVLAVLGSFLPNKSPAVNTAGLPGFARVVLTTRRRAEGLSWSHIIFAESNAGVWPQRLRVSGWLTDEQRVVINQKSRFSLGVFTADERASLEKRSYATLVRDTQEQVIFSAALSDEIETETTLVPNSWLERVLWRNGAKGGDIQQAFERLAAPIEVAAEPSEKIKAWRDILLSRRDPTRAFDEYFFSVDPSRIRPAKLSARLIEAAVADPAVLWFDAVLECERVEQGPLLRSGKRVLGQLAHRILAKALRGGFAEGVFFEKPERTDVERRLSEELRRVRGLRPNDRYWDSFHAGLTQICDSLLGNFFLLETGYVLATEMWLPDGVQISLPGGGEIAVNGRMDVVCADRAEWAGSTVDIVDFKTGDDPSLSAERMAKNGSALQLGVYLAAARSLGAQDGRVWMIKPAHGAMASMEMNELGEALLLLEKIATHLASGRYGALTPDRSTHVAARLVWPLACTPVPAAVLREKFAATFGEVAPVAEEGFDE